jgi:hypothetical protein
MVGPVADCRVELIVQRGRKRNLLKLAKEKFET